jgi:hypothetical protein
MSNDITIITTVEINKEYMLHLHRELWLLREILEIHKLPTRRTYRWTNGIGGFII